MSEKQLVFFRDLGKMNYKNAWEYQERLLKENLDVKTLQREAVEQKNNEQGIVKEEADIGKPNLKPQTSNFKPQTTNHLLFVEHPPVYTLGKSGKMDHVLIGAKEREQKGIEFYQTNRGGDITFHGPDQVVGYPIIDLENFYTDIGRYLRELEEVVILTLAEYGIVAGRSDGETGVWIDGLTRGKERKICAMGVRCSRWITMHGFALNVNTDLDYFNHIIPCGIQNKKVTSMKEELGHEVDMEDVKQKLKKNFEKVFDVIVVDQKDLDR
jgi:lipoyl(octanoyl) transferase